MTFDSPTSTQPNTVATSIGSPLMSPSSGQPVVAFTGGGFGDAPPAWPSATSSSTPQVTYAHSSLLQSPTTQLQGFISRPGTSAEAPQVTAGVRSGVSEMSLPSTQYLPPPPPGGTAGVGCFGAALGRCFGAAVGASPAGREGGILISSTDLLRLESDSDNEREKGDAGGCSKDTAAGGLTIGEKSRPCTQEGMADMIRL